MRNVQTMMLDEIEQELKQLEAIPLGKRTPFNAFRMRELGAAESSIRNTHRRRWW